MPTPQELASQFLIHFNERNRDAILNLLDADMRYNGRYGEGEGVHLLQEWIERATTQMEPRRWFGAEDLAVVEVGITWYSPKTGNITDSATWAIAFATENEKISSISRYADVGEAVTKMGLVEDNALPEAGFPMPTEES